MAGDWIKVRMDLPDDPSVISLASKTGLSDDAVIGKLCRLWMWANRHTSDGKLPPAITAAWIDKLVGHDGFCSAMIEVKWMTKCAEKLAIPNFKRHNGESAKVRAYESARKRNYRNRKRLDVENVRDKNGTCPKDFTGPEKRREEREKNEFVVVDSLRLKPDWTNGQKEALEADARQCGLEPNTLACWVALWGYAQVRDSFVIAAQSGRKPAKIPGLVLTALRAKPHRAAEGIAS